MSFGPPYYGIHFFPVVVTLFILIQPPQIGDTYNELDKGDLDEYLETLEDLGTLLPMRPTLPKVMADLLGAFEPVSQLSSRDEEHHSYLNYLGYIVGVEHRDPMCEHRKLGDSSA